MPAHYPLFNTDFPVEVPRVRQKEGEAFDAAQEIQALRSAVDQLLDGYGRMSAEEGSRIRLNADARGGIEIGFDDTGLVGTGGGITMPFDVSVVTATTVNVVAGRVYYAGDKIPVSAASGLDCSAGTSTTGYVYINVNLDDSTADAVAYTTTEPTSGDADEVVILAELTKDGSGEISAVQQRWRGDFYSLRD